MSTGICWIQSTTCTMRYQERCSGWWGRLEILEEGKMQKKGSCTISKSYMAWLIKKYHCATWLGPIIKRLTSSIGNSWSNAGHTAGYSSFSWKKSTRNISRRNGAQWRKSINTQARFTALSRDGKRLKTKRVLIRFSVSSSNAKNTSWKR